MTRENRNLFRRRTDLCLLVFGFHSAMAVSLFGLKKIDPSWRLTAKPIPCDDFLPTKRIGSSAPNGSGPARNALVLTENNLRKKQKSYVSELDQLMPWKLSQFQSHVRNYDLFLFAVTAHLVPWKKKTKIDSRLRNIALKLVAGVYEVYETI